MGRKMLDVRVGRAPKSATLVQTDAQYVAQLLQEPTFIRLLEECADECTEDWSRGLTVDAREAAFNQLSGVKRFAKFLQVVVERGTQAGRGSAG